MTTMIINNKDDHHTDENGQHWQDWPMVKTLVTLDQQDNVDLYRYFCLSTTAKFVICGLIWGYTLLENSSFIVALGKP